MHSRSGQKPKSLGSKDMKNQWKLLLQRSIGRTSFQKLTTTLHSEKVPQTLSYLLPNAIGFDSRNPANRPFSSQPSPQQHHTLILTDILSKSTNNHEIQSGLESLNMSLNCKTVLKALESLQRKPEIAFKLFNFVSETASQHLRPQTYDFMLAVLGSNKNYEQQFLGFLETMKKKGYRISQRTYSKLAKNLRVLDKAKELYGDKPDRDPINLLCRRVCNLIRRNEWDEDLEKKLRELNFRWSNELVAMVVRYLSEMPVKALVLFQWVEQEFSFKHNELSYNAMLKVLGREDCIDKFWNVVEEMKKSGYEMETEEYRVVIERFYKRKMTKDAVDLFEFVMGGERKPSVESFVVLLQRIVTAKEFDIDMLSRALKIFKERGGNLTDSIFCSVNNSLITSARMQECAKILNAMKNCGFVPTNEVYNGVIFQLGSAGRSNEAIQIIDEMEESGCNPDSETWTSMVRGQCVASDLENASSSFLCMVEKFGVTDAGCAFETLVTGFCRKKRANDAYKLLSEMVDGTVLRPSHATYKTLIGKLCVQRNLNEALKLLDLMKAHDYSLHLDPVIDYISNFGTGTDATRFLKAVTDERSPSTSEFIRMFEAFFKAGRHGEARNCFSDCPRYIRNHPDVLNLFQGQKPEDDDACAVVA